MASTVWQDQAACKGETEAAFYIGKAAVKFARTFCTGCPVREECLRFAVATESEYGVWGGITNHADRVAALHRADRP